MYEVTPHMLIAMGVLGAGSIVAVGVMVTRAVDDRDGALDPTLKPAPDGKSITIGGKTYGLHTIKLAVGPPYWVLSLPVAATRTFSVQRETGLKGLIDHLGIMEKVPTGDARYDAEFEIRSRDASWTTTFFSDPENRRLAQALFGLDSSAVILADGRILSCFREQSALTEGGPALSDLAARLTSPS